MSKTNPARGMRDFLPADVRKRSYVINIIKEVYESYGFEPLETPAVENLETLMGKYGEEGNQLIFKILKRGEKLVQSAGFSPSERDESRTLNELSDLALRYDLTVPLARVVANNKNELPKFFKRYQIQPVWRADRPARGRFREFYQCDVDAIGSTSIAVESEMIAAVSEVLTRLGFENFTIRINHRDILFALMRSFGVAESKFLDAIAAIDKIEKIGALGVEKELSDRGIAHASIGKLVSAMEFFIKAQHPGKLSATDKLKLLELYKMGSAVEDETNESLELLKSFLADDYELVEVEERAKWAKNFIASAIVFRDLKDMLETDEAGKVARRTLFDISTYTIHTGGSRYIRVDPTLARGLSYYTGTIFEITVPDLAGSLGGGGRYDGLIGMFGKEQVPACGVSLGLERILVVMDERGMFPPEIAESAPADVLITVWDRGNLVENQKESLKLASELRQSGLRVTVYPEPDKLGKQLKYADSINVPYVCVLGESEIAEGKVTIKNMRSGEQSTLDKTEVASAIAK